jgi:hypothetical protein
MYLFSSLNWKALTISPGTNSRPFVAIIVDLPILQALTLSLSLLALMIELPVPFVSVDVSDYALCQL